MFDVFGVGMNEGVVLGGSFVVAVATLKTPNTTKQNAMKVCIIVRLEPRIFFIK